MVFGQLGVVHAFSTGILSTYDGFLRTQPRRKSRNICIYCQEISNRVKVEKSPTPLFRFPMEWGALAKGQGDQSYGGPAHC